MTDLADPLLTENYNFLLKLNSALLSNRQMRRNARKPRELVTSAAPRRSGKHSIYLYYGAKSEHFPIHRCDVLPDTEPPLCAHCKQYNYDCTFFLPIQETRFKKKRAEEDPSLQIQQGRQLPLNGSTDRHDSAGTVRTYGGGFVIYPRIQLLITFKQALHLFPS
jgi:hypothetical protein